ncbi:MAG TPA: zinc ribbon domain-containing protein [Conexibacter sp.]|jgi:hypothetical protein|nr:zinc ribbon domain-containing protein [Conexibacter sp.]
MGACASCAATVHDDDAFCGQCGSPVPSPEPERAPTRSVAATIPHRSGYERNVEHLDPLGTPYAAAATRQAIAYTLFAGLATVILLVIGGTGSTARSLVGFVWIGAFVVYLLMPIPVSLSEWKTLVEGSGARAQEVFGHVGYALRRRRVPVDGIGVRQLSQPGHPRRDYLHVRHGILSGYVTCFPYGTDLYVGWTLWWRFSPLHYALMVAGRRWQIWTGRGTELHLLYRYDVAKAMREAMHAATGEAVDAAYGLLPLQPLPTDLPVEVVEAKQLIQPANVPPRDVA